MFLLLRTLLIVFSFCVLAQDAIAQSVPQTFGWSPPGVSVRERNTCDPDFYEVVKNRAWLEAQREITQNSNLITRPDSVLTVSCFDGFLNHLGAYAGYIRFGFTSNSRSGSFPGNPDESFDESGILGIARRLGIRIFMSTLDGELAFRGAEILGLDDPFLVNGFYLYGVLELLILDQLENNVTTLGLVQDQTIGLLGACAPHLGGLGSVKSYYLEDNYPDRLLENRAKTETGPPNWTEITPEFGNSIANRNYIYTCARMNDVWTRAKCYDFATESVMDITSPPVAPATSHDGFYSLEEYRDAAAIGDDYRSDGLGRACPPPSGTTTPTLSGAEIACNLVTHGVPQIPTLLPFPVAGPTWAGAYTGSDPDPSTPGAADAYNHYIQQIGPFTPIDPSATTTVTACADPVKTGYVVRRGGQEYYASTCPNPGCWFNPPSSLSGTGTCSR